MSADRKPELIWGVRQDPMASGGSIQEAGLPAEHVVPLKRAPLIIC